MSIKGKLTSRVLELLGLDLDFSINIGRDLFNQITEDLYLGARPEPAQTPALKEAGITHVVSCLNEDARDKVAFLEEAFRALYIPMRDGIHEDIAAAFPTFFSFIRAARAQAPSAKIFVHCEAGVSRSATLVTAQLMQQTRKPFFSAFRDVRAKRAEVLPNIGFASQLQRLELDLLPKKRDDRGLSSLARYLREVCLVPVEVETLQDALLHHDYDALKAIQAIFGEELPRVVQGVRS